MASALLIGAWLLPTLCLLALAPLGARKPSWSLGAGTCFLSAALLVVADMAVEDTYDRDAHRSRWSTYPDARQYAVWLVVILLLGAASSRLGRRLAWLMPVFAVLAWFVGFGFLTSTAH